MKGDNEFKGNPFGLIMKFWCYITNAIIIIKKKTRIENVKNTYKSNEARIYQDVTTGKIINTLKHTQELKKLVAPPPILHTSIIGEIYNGSACGVNGDARGVMVIVVGNGHGDTSSNSNLDETNCTSHSTNTLGKGMNPVILPPAMGK